MSNFAIMSAVPLTGTIGMPGLAAAIGWVVGILLAVVTVALLASGFTVASRANRRRSFVAPTRDRRGTGRATPMNVVHHKAA